MSQKIGSDFDLVLDTKKVIIGYSSIKIKYQKPILEGAVPVTGFLTGSVYGTGSLKIKVSVPGSLWNALGIWSFITWVEFSDGRILKGNKNFDLEATEEFSDSTCC